MGPNKPITPNHTCPYTHPSEPHLSLHTSLDGLTRLTSLSGPHFGSHPNQQQYLSARSKELAATRGQGGKAKKESVACKAHDILDSMPELNTDVRLAGWRVKSAGGAAAGAEQEQAREAEEPVLADTHKQGHLPAVGDVVEYQLPPHLLLDDGRCVLRGVVVGSGGGWVSSLSCTPLPSHIV